MSQVRTTTGASGRLASIELETPLLLGAATLACSLLLGGGTSGGFLSDAILELLTLPVLLYSAWCLLRAGTPLPARRALIFCAALAAVPLLQLIPLPPGLWTALPGRAPVAEAARLAFGAPRWEPLTLTPASTAQAALSLVPAFAMFGITLLMTPGDRRKLSIVAIAACVIEALLGIAQIAGGPASSLRPFQTTSLDAAVGLFANPNHFALAITVAIVLAAAWSATALQAMMDRSPRRSVDSGPIAVAFLAATATFVFFIGVIASRSRAGLALSLLALASGLTVAPWRPAGWGLRRMLAIVAGCAATIIVAALVLAPAQFAALITRFVEGGGYGDRLVFAVKTAAIARQSLPFGTGVGSFVPVYALHEDATSTTTAIVNRAHCDWIEIVLESGVFGALFLATFCIWFARSALRVWRQSVPPGGATIDLALVRAATLIIALIGLHSLIEYPLRTAGMAAFFALACGLLFEPVATAGEQSPRTQVDGSSWLDGPRRDDRKRTAKGRTRGSRQAAVGSAKPAP